MRAGQAFDERRASPCRGPQRRSSFASYRVVGAGTACFWDDPNVEAVADVTVGDWIRPRLMGHRGSVTAVVPARYEAYVRVLHPVEVDDDRLARWRDVATVTGRRVHPLVQWWRLIDSPGYVNPRSGLWHGGNPETGALEQPDSQVLVDLLARHTDTPDDAYFALWEGSGHFDNQSRVIYRLDDTGRDATGEVSISTTAALLAAGPRMEHPGRNYLLLAGALTEAVTIADLVGAHPWALSGNLVWPTDRAWCIGTEVDFDSTLVGCSRTAADEILSCNELEALPIGPHDSLQYDADLINT